MSQLRAALADRYVIEREIGQGGAAAVYLGHDLKHDRAVAIKVLAPEVSNVVGIERFLREIHVAARLQHPDILPLHDSGQAGGSPYYVMPYVVGGSLRQRLEREIQLPLDEALQITRDVAAALDYAHDQGVVHRDIKPENILLADAHAVVADFGIARALVAAGGEKLTKTGLAVGTPGYMSPEQASGAGQLDRRSDVYSLGCVVYEMLTGSPPFAGPTPQAVIARHLADPVPPVRTVRRAVPEPVELAILRALEKVPADRFQSAGAFATALAASGRVGPARLTRRRLQAVASALGVAVALGIAWVIRGGTGVHAGAGTAPSVDTARYVILPFAHEGGIAPLGEVELLQDALTRWSGIAVVDPFQVRDAIARRRVPVASGADARQVALELGAGRYVRGEVSRVGDSIRIYAAGYDATGGTLVHDAAVRLTSDGSGSERAFTALGDGILFGTTGPGARAGARTGTTSRPARQAFARGQAAVYSWALEAADSAFSGATRYDPDYAEAFLWLAQVRSWSGAPIATWQSAAERAGARRARLAWRDQFLSDALVSLGRGDAARACATWARLTVAAPHDFAPWYGLATCLTHDEAVVRDPASPSRWRFRSSYQQATRAYERAFQLLPSIHQGLSDRSYASVRRLLRTDGSQILAGHAVAPDTTSFLARPSWQGDSLAFVPYPQRVFLGREDMPAGLGLAIRRERQLFHDIATAWATAFPQSAAAQEALAISLGLLGDPAALDTLGRARRLASEPGDRIRLAGAEVWMRVKFSAPADIAGLRRARAVADSLLTASPTTSEIEPLLLASIATLTGRARLAAALSRQRAAASAQVVPPPLAQVALPLLTFSALGGPLDSVRALEQQVDAAIDRGLSTRAQRGARLAWLARAATLAFPDYRFSSLERLAGTGDYLLDAEAALLRGDSSAVRRMLADQRAQRRFALPSDLTFDALYPEARLLAALGESRAAMAWLDPTLAALSSSAPDIFTDPANAGALVRAMALRAELAQQVGESSLAARWAGAVAVLWSNADAFLEPRVRRMERLAGSAGTQ